MTYAEKLKDPRWQKKRLQILERDNWTCQLCGDTTTTFNIHHKKYSGDPWQANDEDLITYCEHCHALIGIAPDQEIVKVNKRKINQQETPFVFFSLVKCPEFGMYILMSKYNIIERNHEVLETILRTDFEVLYDLIGLAKSEAPS